MPPKLQSLAVTVLLSLCGSAAAQPIAPPASNRDGLQWRADAPCPDASWADDELGKMLEGQTAGARARAWRATVGLRQEGPTHQLRLETWLDGQQGSRTLEAHNCESLARVALWLIAVSIDPELETRLPLPSLPPAPAPPGSTPPIKSGTETRPTRGAPATAQRTPATAQRTPTPSATPVTDDDAPPPELPSGAPTVEPAERLPVRPVPETDDRNPWLRKAQLEIRGLIDLGTLPSLAPGIGARLRLGFESWQVETSGLWLAPVEDSYRDRREIRTRFALWSAALGVGRSLRTGRFTLCSLTGIESGLLQAAGLGLVNGEQKHQMWGAAYTRVGLTWHAGAGLRVALDLAGALPLSRPRFVLQDAEMTENRLVHQPDSWLLRAGLGLAYALF